MSGINLTPFGHAHAPAEPNAYALDAFGRAEIKLNALRARVTNERPVGNLGAMAMGPSAALFFLSWPFIIFTLVSFSAKSGGAGAGLIFLLIVLAMNGLAVWLFINARADTPKKALKYYFKAVAAGKGAKAASLVVSNDLDDFPRYPPITPGFGHAGVRPFFNAQYLEGYWNELVRYHSAPYCYVSLHRVNEQQIAPDLVLVDCEVRFMMNTQLWIFLFIVIGIFAIIIDAATRKTVKMPIRKLLYKVGDEWKVFNGELQGPEELDLRWLQSAQTIQSATRPAVHNAPWEDAAAQAPQVSPRPTSEAAPWELSARPRTQAKSPPTA